MLGYYLMPHPPIIINEIGQGRENEAINTLNACKSVVKKIDNLEPETIIIVSPHGTVFRDAIALVTSSKLKGHFGKFNAPHVKLNGEFCLN